MRGGGTARLVSVGVVGGAAAFREVPHPVAFVSEAGDEHRAAAAVAQILVPLAIVEVTARAAMHAAPVAQCAKHFTLRSERGKALQLLTAP